MVDVFVEELDLAELGLSVDPEGTRPTLVSSLDPVEAYIYGYLNRVR